MKIYDRIWKNPGNPTDAALAAIDPEKGDLVIDTSTPALWQKTTDRGDNSGYQAAGIGSGMTPSQQAQALDNLGAGPIYLHVNHQNSSTMARFSTGISKDGISISPIGNPVPYLSPNSASGHHTRDPIPFWRTATREFYALATHATTTPGIDNYEHTLQLLKSSDLARWEFVAEIPINGTGIPTADFYVWSGCVFEDDDGSLYATLSTIEDVDAATLDIGWIKFNDPDGDWTDVTDFTPLTTNNSNYATFKAANAKNNDLCVVKIGGVYHYFFDAGAGGAHQTYHATSTTLFSGMTAPTSLGLRSFTQTCGIANGDATVTVPDSHILAAGMSVSGMGIPGGTTIASITNATTIELSANATATNASATLTIARDVEGQYFTYTPTGDWRIYLQPIFGALSCVESEDEGATWSAPKRVNWPGALSLGNGGVLRLTDLDAVRAVLAAPSTQLMQLDGGSDQLGLRVPADYLNIYVGATFDGNATVTGDKLAVTVAKISTGANWNFVGTVAAIGLLSTDGVITASSTSFSRWVLTTTGLEWQGINIGNDFVIRGNLAGAGFVNALSCHTDGSVTAEKGLILPTSATGVPSGAWWDNAGTLTKKP